MNKRSFFLSLIASAFAVTSFAQTPANKPLVGGRSPQAPVPGLVLRVYLNKQRDAKAHPTHLLCVVQSGKDWFGDYKAKAEGELRGVSTTLDVNYCAFGHIILEKDTEVLFEVRDLVCTINGKEFGEGTFRQQMKKGKYPIEIFRRWGKAQSPFSVTAADGGQVLFYSDEMLNRELNRGIKIEGKTYRSKIIGEPAPGAK